jgi:hypothetical protein
MLLEARDLMQFLAELPDGVGARIDRDAVPEKRVVVGHLLPASTEYAPLPAGSSGPAFGGGHAAILPLPERAATLPSATSAIRWSVKSWMNLPAPLADLT